MQSPLTVTMTYIHPRLSGQKVRCYETLEGLEAEDVDGTCYLLRRYRPMLMDEHSK